jgi:hypothetical protein
MWDNTSFSDRTGSPAAFLRVSFSFYARIGGADIRALGLVKIAFAFHAELGIDFIDLFAL